MGLDLPGNGSSETVYDQGDRNLAADSRVNSNSVVDHRSRRPVVLSPMRNCVEITGDYT